MRKPLQPKVQGLPLSTDASLTEVPASARRYASQCNAPSGDRLPSWQRGVAGQPMHIRAT